MTSTEQANAVIDKIADKLGVAATEVAKGAQTMIVEFQRAYIIATIAHASIALVGIIIFWQCLRLVKKHADGKTDCSSVADEGWIAGGIFGMVIGTIAFFVNIGMGLIAAIKASAPTYYCLKELLKTIS